MTPTVPRTWECRASPAWPDYSARIRSRRRAIFTSTMIVKQIKGQGNILAITLIARDSMLAQGSDR